MLTSADLLARLRSGGNAEPAAVEVEWRSCFDDTEFVESGFDPEHGLDAASDDAALCGDDLTKFGHDERGPWRDTYLIHPATPTTLKESHHV